MDEARLAESDHKPGPPPCVVITDETTGAVTQHKLAADS